MREKKKFVWEVKRGMRHGETVILHGEGDKAVRLSRLPAPFETCKRSTLTRELPPDPPLQPGAPPGDLIFVVQLKPHPMFQQSATNDYDLLTTVSAWDFHLISSSGR